jgi:hypothetical protein
MLLGLEVLRISVRPQCHPPALRFDQIRLANMTARIRTFRAGRPGIRPRITPLYIYTEADTNSLMPYTGY